MRGVAPWIFLEAGHYNKMYGEDLPSLDKSTLCIRETYFCTRIDVFMTHLGVPCHRIPSRVVGPLLVERVVWGHFGQFTSSAERIGYILVLFGYICFIVSE